MSKSSSKYPPEVKERACRLVHDWRQSRERTTGGFNEIGEQMVVHPESLSDWFKQWQIDVGKTAGLTTAGDQHQRQSPPLSPGRFKTRFLGRIVRSLRGITLACWPESP